MVVAYHGLREQYTSLVRLDPVKQMVSAQHIRGPFRQLDTLWTFASAPSGCRVRLISSLSRRA